MNHTWGILRKYDPENNPARMDQTLLAIESRQGQRPLRIGCGYDPLMVELRGIPVSRDSAIPPGYTFFYLDRPLMLDIDEEDV
jgi:hypothetical protein